MRSHLFAVLTGALVACDSGVQSTSFGGVTQQVELSASEGSETATNGGLSTSAQAESDTTSSTTEQTPDPSTGDQTKWDMAVPDFAPEVGGCQGKIDFLFVVSSEGTMEGFDEKLATSYAGFMHVIEEQLKGFDVHILSANTKTSAGFGDCSECGEGCDPGGEPPYCGGGFIGCDKKLGAGVVFPTGEDAANRRCKLDSGLRYITSGQKDLAETFTCTAQVGLDGAGLSGEAMTAAVQPAINDPQNEDACNTGFLRDDALLVVTIIQDSYDFASQGTVDAWISALDGAKGGDPDGYAVIVYTTDIDVGYGQLCHPDVFSGNKNRLRLLTEGVEHGFIESFCVPDFTPFFAARMADVIELCDRFVVPG